MLFGYESTASRYGIIEGVAGGVWDVMSPEGVNLSGRQCVTRDAAVTQTAAGK
jgi:hypothetical protein